MEYLKIANWDKWQSYRKDRGQPPWIKLHRELLRHPEWASLSDSQRGQLVVIWLLAADRDGVIPASSSIIQKIGLMDKKPDLESFIEQGFIENDANAASARRQHDRTESDTDAEVEAETDKTLMPSQMAVCPYEKIKDLYHKILPNHPRVRILTPARKSAIKQRHVGDMESDLETWASYFRMIDRSDFLAGRTQSINGRKVFIADLEWITKQGNFVKIYEGKYHGKI